MGARRVRRMCQRWRQHRTSYRPKVEPIDTSKYGVEEMPEMDAKSFVCTHHYSASYPPARRRMGLYRAGDGLVGVAVFSVPCQIRTIPCYAPNLDPSEGVELGRFVLLDDVPANGETWFLSRAFKLLRKSAPELKAVLSYADPIPRTTPDGLVKPGHIGTIYQAYNGKYLGRSGRSTHHFAPNGEFVSRRALSKIRQGERGGDGAYRSLVRCGAPTIRHGENGVSYVSRLTNDGLLRKVRHPGNHVYIWTLDKGVQTKSQLGYPKAGWSPDGREGG